MLPSGKTYRAFVQLTKFFVGQEFNFDIRLILKAEEVPYCQLKETAECPPQLGWTTWLKCQDLTQDADEVIFAGEADWKAPGIRLSTVN